MPSDFHELKMPFLMKAITAGFGIFWLIPVFMVFSEISSSSDKTDNLKVIPVLLVEFFVLTFLYYLSAVFNYLPGNTLSVKRFMTKEKVFLISDLTRWNLNQGKGNRSMSFYFKTGKITIPYFSEELERLAEEIINDNGHKGS